MALYILTKPSFAFSVRCFLIKNILESLAAFLLFKFSLTILNFFFVGLYYSFVRTSQREGRYIY